MGHWARGWVGAAMLSGCTTRSVVTHERSVVFEGRGYVAPEMLVEGGGLQVRWSAEGDHLIGRLTRPVTCRAADLRYYRDERLEVSQSEADTSIAQGAVGVGLGLVGLAIFLALVNDPDRDRDGDGEPCRTDYDERCPASEAAEGAAQVGGALLVGGLIAIPVVAIAQASHSAHEPEATIERTRVGSGIEVLRVLETPVPCGQSSLDDLVLTVERQASGAFEVSSTELRPQQDRVRVPAPEPGVGLRIVVAKVPDDLLPLVQPGTVLYEAPSPGAPSPGAPPEAYEAED